jgi:anti-anti-sigma factor
MSTATIFDEWFGDMPVARVEGEVDADNTPELAGRLHSLVTNRSVGLVVDLSATTYLDSAGINLLFTIGEELLARQQQLRLVIAPESPIARMIALTGLDRVHPVHDSVIAALEGR